jgi:hypothetical protein
MPKCRFDESWNVNPFDIPSKHFSPLRDLARLLNAQAILEAQGGDRDSALRVLQSTYAMVEHSQDEPTLIGFFNASAIEAIANRALSRILETVPINRGQAQSFLANKPDVNWNKFLVHSMTGERATGIMMLEMLRSGPEAVMKPRPGDVDTMPAEMKLMLNLNRRIAAPILKLDEVQYLRAINPLIASLALPPDLTRTYRPPSRSANEFPFYAIYSRVMVPGFSKLDLQKHIGQREVSNRQMKIALALACYHTQYKRYPRDVRDAMKLWGEELPLDPYSNQPFLYKSDGRI